MEADQISLYTDFPDIAYNVYFKRRQVLGFDEDGFPIISKEPVKNGDIAQYSDVEEEEEEDHRTPTPLPKREPFAYPTEYLDPPFTYDPYRNIDSEVLVPTEVEHVFNFPALKESAVRFRVPGRKHLQNAYPLQQFGLKGKAKSRHRKQLPNPMHIKVTRKLPQLMYRPPKDASLDQIVQEQKAKPRKEVESSPREEYDITPHDHKAPLTLKLSKAQESLSLSIDKRSPRSPRSPRYTAKKGKLRSRGSQRSAKSAQPSKRYQAIIETSSPRPATSTSNRSLKSAISTGSKSARVDTPKSVSIRALSPGPPVIDTHEDFTHPKPSRIVVPKLSINIPPKSMLKNTMTSVRNERPETGRKSVIFQDEEKPTRPSTSATRIDEAPLSASKLAKEKTVGLSLSRHKPHYRPYESELVETYRPESQITRPDSPLYRPVSSSTRASSPTIHPKPVIHDGVTVQRRSDFIMFNPPTNLSFNVGLPPNDHSMKLMKPPPALIKVKPKPRRSTIRLPHRFNDMEVWDDNISATGSFFMTEIPDSPLPSRASGGSHISDRHSFRSRRQSKVRFKKDSPPPAYTEAAHDTVIESAREGSQYNLV